jgi:hypothetical protein
MKEDNLSKIERREVGKMIANSALAKASALNKEFKKQTSTAIMAAFGLIIALAWKDVITELVNQIGFVKSYGLLVTAIILTAVSVIGILLISKWANSGTEDKI